MDIFYFTRFSMQLQPSPFMVHVSIIQAVPDFLGKIASVKLLNNECSLPLLIVLKRYLNILCRS